MPKPSPSFDEIERASKTYRDWQLHYYQLLWFHEPRLTSPGVSQSVTARAGLARVAEVPVTNPVTLRPYRTFAEVEQPASPFILRLKRKDGEMPQCALFEADGGKWKIEAIQNIARALRVLTAELPEGMREIPIIA